MASKKKAVVKKKAKQVEPVITNEQNTVKEVKAKHPGGRPTIYTEELAQELIDRYTSGESMTSICDDEHMPCVTTVFYWREQNKEFLKRYTRARKRHAEVLLYKSRAAAEQGVDYAYSIPPTVQDAAKANAVANMLKLQIGRYDHLAACFNEKFAPHQTQKIKQDSNVTVNDKRSAEEIFESIKTKASLPQNKKKHDDKDEE